MKKLTKLLLAFFFWLFFVTTPLVSAQTAAGGNCSLVGNNLAFYSAGSNDGASSTLILLQRGGVNAEAVIQAINSYQNVIVRLGAGEGPIRELNASMAEADGYINALRNISARTNGKSFTVTASHNEANCAENIPFEIEMAFARKMAGTSIPGVTWISGQVDFYCGDYTARGDKAPSEYIAALSAIPGISGISLPFYTADAGGNSDAVLGLFNAAAGAAGGKPIYITESGAYKRGSSKASPEEFLDYVKGVSNVLSNGNVKALLLFNALGLNSDPNFSYTEPFWSKECRVALRTNCSNAQEVTDICMSGSGKKNPYYVEPINGMYDYALNGLTDPNHEIMDKIYEDLIAQGYQAWCTVPSLNYIASNNTDQTMLKAIIDDPVSGEKKTGNRVTVNLEDYKQFFNYIDAQTPIWRKNGVYVLSDKNSLEGFWSNKSELEKVSLVPVDYTPAFVLSSPESQCKEKLKILEAIETKCQTLEDPSECALDISFDPESFNFWELKKQMTATGFSCDQMNKPNPPPGLSEDDRATYLKIKSSILTMPYALPTAYRFAFAIYSAELREPRIPSEVGASWLNTTRKPGFDFLRFDPGIGVNENNAQPRSEVRILAFLVPDFATNIDNANFTYTPPPEVGFMAPGANLESREHVAKYSGSKDYADAAKIARNALLTIEQLDQLEENWRNQKELVTFPAVKALFDPELSDQKLIECLNGTSGEAPAKYRCEKPLEMALTTFVNRRMENPEACHKDAINWEENSKIFNNAGIQKDDAGLFSLYNGQSVNALTDGFYPQNVANSIPSDADSSGDDAADGQKVYEFRFMSHYSFTSFLDGSDPIYGDPEPPRDQDAKVTIHGYLVYPQGRELASIEDTLLNAFLTEKQIKDFNKEERSPFFKLKGIVQSFLGKTARTGGGYASISQEECSEKWAEYLASGTPTQTEQEFRNSNCGKVPEASIESETQTDKEPRILGARLGIVTIKIQQALRSVGSSSWRYITSCLESDTPTEDFLTGNCSGRVENDGVKEDTGADEIADYMNSEVFACPAGGKAFNNGEGEYTLTNSEVSCTIADSIDENQVADDCTANNPTACAKEYVIPKDTNIKAKQDIPEWLNKNDRVTCDDAFFSKVVCTFNPTTKGTFKPSLIAHKVDETGRFTATGSKTACDWIQDEAAKRAVSPRLALAIWLEETGASAYSTERGGADFGVISVPTSRQSGTIADQLRLFLGTINTARNIGYPRFLLQYSGEDLYATSDPDDNYRDWDSGDRVLFCRNRAFAGRVKSFYEQLAPFAN